MLLEIPPEMNVSGGDDYLKGKITLVIYEQIVDMKLQYCYRELWCRDYYVETVGKKKSKSIRELHASVDRR